MKSIVCKKDVFADAAQYKGMRGVTLVELIIVLVIISILSAVSLPYFYNYTRLYKSEDQSLKVMDLMREASQLALTRRRTMRLEIDTKTDELLIIDENAAGAADDTVIKAIALEEKAEIRMDRKPTGVPKANPPNYNNASFGKDNIGHQRDGVTVTGNRVWAARFKSDGTVVDAADTPISATLYVWSPLSAGSNYPRNETEVRAISIFGGSGAVRYWRFDGNKFQPF